MDASSRMDAAYWSVCRAAIAAVERASAARIPDHLLAAIAHVESGRRDPQTGQFAPWPWTINAEGRGAFFESKAAAIAAVRDLQASGVRSIDVGCMQINLMHHPDAFASLEQAFDPLANATYAARFLTQLYGQSGDWVSAAGLYHSATPDLAAGYERQVLAALPAEKQDGGSSTLTQLAAAWGSTFTPAAPIAARMAGSIAGPGGIGYASGHGRIIPLTAGAGGPSAPGLPATTAGRGLDAYRAAPITLASNMFRSPGR